MAIEDDRLLKVTEVAEHLGVSMDWVYERINRGELPVVELGENRKNQRVTRAALNAFIDARTFPSSAREAKSS